MFCNNIIDIIMHDFFCFHDDNKNKVWRHIYHDIGIPRAKNHDVEIPRPKNRDIEIRGLKHHGIEKWRQISHGIVIPRCFFRVEKATISRFQDQKATTSSSCGILTLMPPDKHQRNTPEQRNLSRRRTIASKR